MRRAFLLGLRRQLVLETDRPGEQVDVDAEQPLGCLAAHRVRDGGAHVAPLGDVARVAEAVHQLRPRACDAAGLPAELGRLAREAVARQGRQHQVECVLGGAAVSGRVGQRADGLQQLDDRAGPAMRHDQRQRILMPRPDVDEVDVDPVDLGRELRQRVQSSPRTCASRTRSSSSGRAPAASPAARPATDPRRVPWWASASPRCAGGGHRRGLRHFHGEGLDGRSAAAARFVEMPGRRRSFRYRKWSWLGPS